MKLFYLLVLFSFFNIAEAQYQFVTAGGTANGSGGTATSSFGLPLYTHQRNSATVILQGNQQPYEFFSVSYKALSASDAIKVYPNPAQNYFYIETNSTSELDFSYRLYALDGKLIEEGNFSESIQPVFVKELAPGMYHLLVSKAGELILSSKIIKIN